MRLVFAEQDYPGHMGQELEKLRKNPGAEPPSRRVD